MSRLEVIGGISAIIAIIDASVKIWERAQQDIKLPETFQTVARRLPLFLSLLQTCHDQLDTVKETLPADVIESFTKIVKKCKAEARQLRDVFEDTVRGENAGRLERYKVAVKSISKGKTVEQLLKSISEDTRELANYYIVKSTRPELLPRLDELIKELEKLDSSMPEESAKNFYNSNYSGQQNISTGDAHHSGHGNLHNYGGVGTINQYAVPNRPEPVKVTPLGLCFNSAPLIELTEFVGRAAEIDNIHAILRPDEPHKEQKRVVLGGIGGIGKTQLAIAYARQYQQIYTSVLWLNAISESTLYASLLPVAQLIGTEELDISNNEQVLSCVLKWLSRPDNTQWLLIFDNYDKPDLLPIQKFCPSIGRGSIIITSRLPDLVKYATLRVQPLQAITDSLRILEIRSGRAGIREEAGAKRLAARLNGFPLALVTAGAFLRKSAMTFDQYLDAYERKWKMSPRRPQRLQDYQDRTLHTTWNVSYHRLHHEDPDAAQMLRLLAYFDNQEVWYELLRAGLSDHLPEWLQVTIEEQTSFESIMSTLVDYCLVEVQHISQSYSMHNCVHDWALGELNATISPELYWYAFTCVANSIGENDKDGLDHVKYSRVGQHGKRLTRSRFEICSELNTGIAGREHESVRVANMLASQVHLLAAERMYMRAVAGYETALGPDHSSTLMTVGNLGALYWRQGKLEQAEQMYLRAMAGFEAALGPGHSTLQTANNLGLLYADQGKLDQAEQMYLRALAGFEAALWPDHTSTLDTVRNLGNLYADQGKLEQAEQMYLRALTGFEAALGPDHTSTLETVNNIGSLYMNQGKLDQAEQMYLRALAGLETALGPDHSSTLQTARNLFGLYRAQDRVREAVALQMKYSL